MHIVTQMTAKFQKRDALICRYSGKPIEVRPKASAEEKKP